MTQIDTEKSLAAKVALLAAQNAHHLAEHYARNPIRIGGRTEESHHRTRCDLLAQTMRDLVGAFPEFAGDARAEETACLLIRKGYPRDRVTVTAKYLTIRLDNAEYRIYRELSGNPAGAVRVRRGWQSRAVWTGLSSEGLAVLLPALDEVLPRIDQILQELSDRMDAIDRQALADMRAREIEDETVRALIFEYLYPLGIQCTFSINNGLVTMDLSRRYEGAFVLPLERLPAFLADPKKVEAILTPTIPQR